jgi:polar amino acid transport system substrate-binding protein
MTTIAVMGILLALPALVAGCGSAGVEESASASPSAVAPITEQQVVDLVDATCAAIEKDAPGTLAAINAGAAPYVDPSNPALYAFVFDLDVSVAANPHPEIQGQHLKGKPDAAGKLFRDEIVAGALAKGSGWEQYVYAEPGTDGLQLKTTYYKLAHGSDGQQYVVGAGRYLGPWEGTSQPSPSAASAATQAEVKAFVDEAAAYVLAHDKATAIAEFMKPSGAFVRGDLYIFAYDFDGTVLCLPMEPGKVGENRWDVRDDQGVYYVREAVETARTSGSGWVRYTYANPSEGYQVQEKSSYVRKVGATWLIGAGTYRQID